MEDISSKLNSGNHVVTAQIISKLVQIIKAKRGQDILELSEFKFLKEKCIQDDNGINIVAAEGILSIARTSDLPTVKHLLTEFVSVISTIKCSSNVGFLINNLLLIELHKEVSLNGTYKSGFNLRLPQHPLLIMLSEDLEYWPLVYREIVFTYKNAKQMRDVLYYNDLYKPIFLYTLCGPLIANILAFQQKMWNFLLRREAIYDNCASIQSILKWMQFENKETIEVNSEFLTELSCINKCKRIFDTNLLVLWQTSTLHQLISYKLDPRDVIVSIFYSLEGVDDYILNPVLLILSKCISTCLSVYLRDLLRLCKAVLKEATCDVITGNVLKAALLQWITNPSELIPDAITSAKHLFSLLENEQLSPRHTGFKSFNKDFCDFLCTNTEVYFSIQIYALLESWKNESNVLTWLLKLEKAPIHFLIPQIEFLLGVFLTEFEDKSITAKSFELIQKCIDYNKPLASNVLTVVLFKLTSVVDSKLHLLLLKAVPKMAVARSNFQKVVATIQALNKESLKTFSTTLMLDLWKVDNKCYPYLENFLIDPWTGKEGKWEFYVTKAYVLKELCAMKPELYGKEIVAHLSKILNDCNHQDGAVPSALAIDGITLLCKSEIIDAVTTWATLSPMFQTESRIPVIQSLCGLISEIPSLSYSETYPQLIEEVLGKLWGYLVLNPNDEVWASALRALTHFSVDQIVALTPEEFFDEETVNLRKAGHIVPGNCWIHFLKNCTESKLNIAGDFLIKLVSLEISSYLKFVYQVKGTREPVDYSYLSANSVVRGLSTYIKSKVVRWKNSVYKEVYLQCLRIFSQEYSKPLPPLDWCFLQELFHEPQAREFCVDIAAHQVVLSGTARRFIVNYIEAVTENYTEEDVLLIYRNFRHLANSIQPFTLKPFFEVTITSAVDLYKNGQEGFLLGILKHVKETLKDAEIQEANKIVIAEIISSLSQDVQIDSKLFDEFLHCIILFPLKCVDDMSSPKCVKEARLDWFKKAVKIRCCLALRSETTPLNFLNDLMEAGSDFPKLESFVFEEFAAVFAKHQENTDCVLWVLELIGQIQAVTAEKSEKKEVFFLCNVFVLATIVFSGHGVFLRNFSDLEMMIKLFPRAVASLLDVNHWSICTTQALEWFHYMTTERLFSKEYKNMFVECLQALRHESEFSKNMKWTKYLNVECSAS